MSEREHGTRPLIIDLFAGPGGWSQGLRMLSPELHATEIGLEWDAAACVTRAAAGHRTIRTDIAAYPTERFTGAVGLIASPPCQDFSLAGKRAGITGERGQLITEVLRWAEDLRPEWIACEQVPPALPVWKQYAEHLRHLGYSAWAGVLNAADYGVPQTRRRAFLIASRVRDVRPPEPTHAEHPAPSLFGDDLLPWATMADALGWGRVKPAWTLAGGTGKGGADPMMQGGSGARKQTADEIASGQWVFDPNTTPAWTICSGTHGAPDPFLSGGQSVRRRIVAGIEAGLWEIAWPAQRPSTTVMGTNRVAHPKHRGDEESQFPANRTFTPEQIVSGQYDNDGPIAIKLTPQDALTLQSFPTDYPVSGSKTKQFEQIGNAVPPLLAAHVLAAATGTTLAKETQHV